MPFGLSNAPAIFQALVNGLLWDMLNHYVFVYLVDILIFWTLDEHVSTHCVLGRGLQDPQVQVHLWSHPTSAASWSSVCGWSGCFRCGCQSLLSQRSAVDQKHHPCAFSSLWLREIIILATESCWQWSWCCGSGSTGWKAIRSCLWLGLTTRTWTMSALPRDLTPAMSAGPSSSPGWL